MSSLGRLGFALSLSLLGCSSKPNPFAAVPECMGSAVTPLSGSRQMLISSLAIADTGEGLDLDGDGKVDNHFGLVGGLANSSLTTTFTTDRSLAIAIEMFGYNGEASLACTKLGVYLAKVNKDRDADGKDTSPKSHDCLDTDATVPRAEDLANRLDDDCDGFADNATPNVAPTDTMDLDGDGQSPAQGDCDDRNDTPEHLALAKSRHKGAVDTCDDGIDQDCDGIPDNGPGCNPFAADNTVAIDVVDQSFKDPAANPLVPLISFTSGSVKNNILAAGPGLFSVRVPVAGLDIDLQLSGARISGTLVDVGGKTQLQNALLGGVLEAVTLQQIKGLDFKGVVTPDQSLLDVMFVSALTNLLGLPQDKDQHYMADMDVDGDGLEAFWNEIQPPAGKQPSVDTCRDGDGTVIHSTPDAPCALAKDAKGNYRFVDGVSVALRLAAVPTIYNPTLVPR